MKEERSRELFTEAQKWMPGGVNSPVRAYGSVGRVPRFIASAKGSKIVDADGNSYIDYVCSWGPGILGHADMRVIEAVKAACDDGLSYGAPTEKEIVIARLIHELMPEMEMLRLVNSGTEAVMSAIRVARGYTGRDKIIKLKGCYHGHSDGLLVKAGSAALTTSMPDSAGVPSDYSRNTLIADYNDRQSIRELFDANEGQIAAVIVEPVAANMGVVLPEDGYLSFLRKITEDNDSLLIFDEVITGFRLGPGGACAYYRIKPDLITLGKIVGGGMPIGAYGGRREIMETVSPLGPVYQAGTLSGNPIAVTAGIATLTILKEHPEIYSEIGKKAIQIEKVMKETFGDLASVNRIGSLMSIFFTRQKVTDYKTATSADAERYAQYFSHMLDQGIYLAPSQFEAMFVSCAHSQEDIDRTCDAIHMFGSKLS